MSVSFFRMEIEIRPEFLDEMNHVNNVHYVQWMQDVAVGHSEVNDWPAERYVRQGAAWFARRHTVEYLHPAVMGDTLIVETWLAECRNVTCLRKYRFYRKSDMQLIATAETKWGFVKLATGRPTKIFPALMENFVILQEAPPKCA